MSRMPIGAALFAIVLSEGAFAQQGQPGAPVNANIVNSVPLRVVTPAETHMGVSAAEHVNLGLVGRSENEALCGFGGATFSRTTADGSREFGAFTVPAGKALVITDIGAGVIARQDFPWTVGTLVTVDLRFGASTPTGIQWQATVVVDAAMAAAQRLWVNERVLSGVVFGPGQVVCMKGGLGLEAGNGNANLTTLNRLHGYLTPYTP